MKTYCNLAAGNEQFAPNGEKLPVTPRVKGNITGRYNFPVFQYAGYVQGSAEYVGARTADLRAWRRPRNWGRNPPTR